MKIFLKSLLSRKFILTLIGFCALLASNAYWEAVALASTYIGLEGGADIVDRYKGGSLKASDIDKFVKANTNDEETTDKLVSGGGRLKRSDEE